jgi:mRNA-degrading endonuclease RelE of RelBE toxin-antitoxin system
MSETASYNVKVHKRALAELRGLPEEERDRMTDHIKECGQEEQPTGLACAHWLEGSDLDLFAVRVNKQRAICHLDKPELKVLAVGDRDTIYNRLETAVDRGTTDE